MAALLLYEVTQRNAAAALHISSGDVVGPVAYEHAVCFASLQFYGLRHTYCSYMQLQQAQWCFGGGIVVLR